MKICFAIPRSSYFSINNVFSLTFPRIIADLKLEDEEYIFFDRNKSKKQLSDVISEEKISHIFITSITSTFPDAIQIAKTGKQLGCTILIGGLFATLNYQEIFLNFPFFDIIVVGKPDEKIFRYLTNNNTRFIYFENDYKMNNIQIHPIINNSKFIETYKGDTVCYEITNGCLYDCEYCTLRAAWGKTHMKTLPNEYISEDLSQLSKKWRNLKIIDDDFLLDNSLYDEISVEGLFSSVIIETRPDRITTESVKKLKEFGTTHVILGVESFASKMLVSSKKTYRDDWFNVVDNALRLCRECNIITRPVIMITAPGHSLEYLQKLIRIVKNWNPSCGVEVLLAFFTPHPGLKIKTFDINRLITNDLIKYDHLNLVYLPKPFKTSEIYQIIDFYEEIVETTMSRQFNPKINISNAFFDKYSCFF